MIALYPRVSTQEQAKDGYSIDEQIDRLKKYCEAMGWKEYKIYTDAGYSGADLNRPALQQMLKDIRKGKIEKVVVYKLDRLSRSQKDTLNLIEDEFLKNNVDFVSMNENFDTSTPFGRAMIGILAVFAQLEREQIKERMAMGKEGRAKEGKWGGGSRTPFGYDYIDGELIINEYEAMIFKKMVEMFLQGYSVRRIEKTMAEKGYRTKMGKPLSNAGIREMFNNKVCAGYIRYHGEYYKGTHEPIIDEETMDKVIKISENRKKKAIKYKSRTGSTYSSYLAGKIYCGRCGAKYYRHNTTSKYSYYSCYSRRKISPALVIDPNCMNKHYPMEQLDNIILEEIKKLAIDPNYISEIKKQNNSQEELDKIQIIKDKIEKINAQKSRFMDLYGLGEFSVDELQKKILPLNHQKTLLEQELESIKQEEVQLSESETIKLVSNIEDILQRNEFVEIRTVIDTLIDRITVDDENITIKWNFV